MGVAPGGLIPSALNPSLEIALQNRLNRRRQESGSHGVLETLAVRLALIQNRMQPQFESGRIVVFAGDHGLAVDGIYAEGRPSTTQTLAALAAGRLPLAMFAQLQGLGLTVVDSGVAESVPPHARLLARKIAHGTRNCRVGAAMSIEQVHAAIRAGMEIGDAGGGDAVACAGIGTGSTHSAALVLSCMSGIEVGEFIESGGDADARLSQRQLRVLELARERHGHLDDPVEVLAGVGGFEIAMMVGLMLEAASRRRVIISDGLGACAALMVASAIAPATPGYCVHTRSNRLPGADRALGLFGAQALFDLGFDSIDGTGASFAWPLVRGAAALLADTAEEAPARANPKAP